MLLKAQPRKNVDNIERLPERKPEHQREFDPELQQELQIDCQMERRFKYIRLELFRSKILRTIFLFTIQCQECKLHDQIMVSH